MIGMWSGRNSMSL